MSKETAERWAAGFHPQASRELIRRNLFPEVAFADHLVTDGAEHDDEPIRTTGYWLFARLCIAHSETVARISKPLLLRHAVADLKSESLLLRQSALNALKFLGRRSKEHAAEILQSVELLEGINEISKSEMLDLLRFEFEFTG